MSSKRFQVPPNGVVRRCRISSLLAVGSSASSDRIALQQPSRGPSILELSCERSTRRPNQVDVIASEVSPEFVRARLSESFAVGASRQHVIPRMAQPGGTPRHQLRSTSYDGYY